MERRSRRVNIIRSTEPVNLRIFKEQIAKQIVKGVGL